MQENFWRPQIFAAVLNNVGSPDKLRGRKHGLIKADENVGIGDRHRGHRAPIATLQHRGNRSGALRPGYREINFRRAPRRRGTDRKS